MRFFIEEITQRWIFLRSLAVFLLAIFGILALGTEVVDVANGYFNLSLTPQMGLGVVLIILLWVTNIAIFGTNFELSSKDNVVKLISIFLGLFFPTIITLFLIGGFFLDDPQLPPRLAANGLAMLLILWEAFYTAYRYYKSARTRESSGSYPI